MSLPSREQVSAERLSRSLRAYIPAAWHVVEPKTIFRPNWHIDVIAEHLEAVSAGEIRRLLINIPPRHMKSLAVSVFWPTWSWTRKPETRWLFTSYGAELATRDSLKCRRIIDSPWYQNRWGERFSLTTDQNVKTRFENDKTGFRLASSVAGMATGEGGDVLVADDPHKVKEAESELIRQGVLEWWDGTMSTRLNDPKTGAKVIVMQRVHEDDLAGHVLAQDRYVHLCLPAEYEPQHPFVWPDDPRREPGELLWPSHFGAPELADLKLDLGAYGAAGQLQQRPAPAEGGILKRAWWRYFDPDNLEQWRLPELYRLVTSWDTALKDKTTNDYCVGTVWGARGADRFLLRRVRERMGLPETKTQVAQLATWVNEHFPNLPHVIVVENAANGPDVVVQLRSQVGGLVLHRAEGDKIQRAHAVSGVLEAGNVLVPGAALNDGSGYDPARTPAWVQELIDECSAFPNASNDDQVDSLSQALLRLKGSFERSALKGEERDGRALSAGVITKSF